MRFATAAALAAFLCAPVILSLSKDAHAGGLDDALRGDAGECVPMSKIEPLITHSQMLNAAQFDFVRGYYMAAPPPSDELPIGDRAELITDGEVFGVILIDTEAQETCARFHVHDIAGFVTIISAVGDGKTVSAKDAAGNGL